MDATIIRSVCLPSVRQIVALVSIILVVCQSHVIAETPDGLPETISNDPLSDGQCDALHPAHTGVLWNGCGCRFGWGCCHHLDPTGDLTTRVPYQSVQDYYYRRPYNSMHVTQHAAADEAAVQRFSPRGLPYANDGFQAIYQNVEGRLMSVLNDESSRKKRDDVVLKDRPLEYVDWKKHRDARLTWDAEASDDFAARLNMASEFESDADRPKSSRRNHQ